MEKYQLFSQGIVESTKKFEKRLNEICEKGWKPISIGTSRRGSVILLEKSDKYSQE